MVDMAFLMVISATFCSSAISLFLSPCTARWMISISLPVSFLIWSLLISSRRGLGAGRAGVLGHGFYDGGAVSRGSDFFPEVLEFIGEEDEGEDEVVGAGEGQGFFECLEAVFFFAESLVGGCLVQEGEDHADDGFPLTGMSFVGFGFCEEVGVFSVTEEDPVFHDFYVGVGREVEALRIEDSFVFFLDVGIGAEHEVEAAFAEACYECLVFGGGCEVAVHFCLDFPDGGGSSCYEGEPASEVGGSDLDGWVRVSRACFEGGEFSEAFFPVSCEEVVFSVEEVAPCAAVFVASDSFEGGLEFGEFLYFGEELARCGMVKKEEASGSRSRGAVS